MDKGKLTVKFQGICTFFPASAIREVGTVAEDVEWRVVLVNAINGLAHVDPNTSKSMSIPPHDATMGLGQQEVAATVGPLHGLRQAEARTWGLRGVRLSVENASSPQQLAWTNQADLPSLHAYAQPAGKPMAALALDRDVVAGQRAAALFDISCGNLDVQFYTTADRKTAFVEYTVETEGNPILNVDTFFDEGHGTIEFADRQVSIVIDNTGESKDTWWDFMLHYLACGEVPVDAFPPGPPGQSEDDGLTSGCSASIWP